MVENLEARQLLAHFAVIGDFSSDNQTAPTRDVANLVKSWNPDFVATVGDNNYPDGAASTIDSNVGQWYHQFISPYTGSFGGGASTNRFWPSIGNHDWNSTGAGYSPYLNYFTLPGNERYYTTVQGNVQLFIINSDSHEPDGTSSSSIQGQWLQNALAQSTAKWKLVLFHHPAFSSGTTGSNTYMQWPFQQWGASAVINGHDHIYERINKNGFPYFVNGLGGESIFGFNSPISGSQVRYESDYGAQLIDTTDTSMTFQFINRSGQVIDTFTLGSVSSAPSTPTGLTASPQSSTQVKLTWTDASPSVTQSFKIERSTDGGQTFNPLNTTLAGVTTYFDSGLAPGATYVYRVRASNSAGDSQPSAPASATLPTGSTTFISDMTWVSSTNGWGPVERDKSVGGQNAGDGNTITLNGVTYTKGLGAHAASTVVVNLNKQFSTFMADVGVDDETGPGTVIFQLLGDGVKIYDSALRKQADAGLPVSVDVSKVNQLTLVVTNGGDNTQYDHADWANARLQSAAAPQPPPAPTNLISTAVSPTQINVTWQDVINENGYRVERSTDGTNFTPIGTVGADVVAYPDKTVSGNTLYYYRVIATSAAGDSQPSNVDTARPMQPPSAPDQLTATAAGANQVNLAWHNTNIEEELNYIIERSLDGQNGWTQVGSVGEVESASDTNNVQPSTTYFYRVYASNLAGNSGYSNIASATTSANNTPVPVTYIPTGSTWKYLDNGTNQGTAWRATTFNDSAWKSGAAQLGYGDGDEKTVVGFGASSTNKFITTYFRQGFSVADPSQVSGLTLRILRDDGAVVYVNGTEIFRTNMPTGTISNTTRASSAVEDNTFYSATFANSLLVAGTNVIAVEIHQSDPGSSDISFDFELKAQVSSGNPTPTAPLAPSGLAASAASASQINLTWADNSSNETGFILERSTDNFISNVTQIATPAQNATSYSDSFQLQPNATYYYRIRATNNVGPSGNSNIANATTQSAPTAPAAPSNLVATAASSSQINLTWTDNASNETGFIVERSTDNFVANVLQVGTPAANATSFSDTGLQPNTLYYYRVRATNGVGPSANSNTASTTTQPAPVGLPAPWAEQDLGSPGAVGSATYSNGVFTIKGAGDIWSTADSGHFVYQPWTAGNGQVIARVSGYLGGPSGSYGGVMIRESLAAGAREASLFIDNTGLIGFVRRTSTGGTSSASTASASIPYWLKVIRNGSTFTAFRSSNGTTWTQVGSAVTISMTAGTVYFGLAAASGVTGQLATLTLDGAQTSTSTSSTLPGTLNPAPVTAPKQQSVFGTSTITAASVAETSEADGDLLDLLA